ncbi:AlpA family phage regulatory protein [Sphingobium sp. H39-3-25]|uniref:helix-turn-helix transcriptional regulator n=1 Tax=Sphingobium arseniciresistens TaxID=3030834 RepID=UPI0023B9B7B2|nr:AlpA family phage regulatory protein [Sphingobium arseniciresistens]
MKLDTAGYPLGPHKSADEVASLAKDRRTDRLLRKPAVAARTGMSISSIYRREVAGRFPRRFQIGLRSVAWYESDIDEFIADPLGYRSRND